MVKLSVSIQNLKTFKEVDKSLFDRFYLGYPFCLEKSGSFMVELDHLKQALNELKSLNKQIFLVTPALMQNNDFKTVEEAITAAVAWGLDGIEINDLGMFSVAKKWPQLNILAGFFANIYHPEAAAEYINEGATTVLAHPELMFKEIKEIVEQVKNHKTKDGRQAEAGVVVYGNLPLGVVYDCYLKTVEPDGRCQQQCCKPYYFNHSEFAMRNIGKANIMATEFCLLEHIDNLKQINANYWRLETYLYDAQKINAIGRAFVDCINGAGPAEHIANLKEMAPKGLCDGWFLGKSGHGYTGKTAISNQLSAVSEKT